MHEVAARALEFLDTGQVTVRSRGDAVEVMLVAVVEGRGGRATTEDPSGLERAVKQATLAARQPRAWPTPSLPTEEMYGVTVVRGTQTPPALPDGLRWAEWNVVDEELTIAATWNRGVSETRAYGHGVVEGTAGDRTVRLAGAELTNADEALALLGRGPATPLAAHVPECNKQGRRVCCTPCVFGPDAVAAVLAALGRTFGVGLALDPGRLNSVIAPPGTTIVDNAPGRFDAEGTPRIRVELVEDGVLRRGVHDLSSPEPSTGHATLALTLAPQADHLQLSGGTAADIDELIERAGTGLYVPALERLSGRLHTRGAAAIDGGRITGAVADGPFDLDAEAVLASIALMTTARRTARTFDVPAVLWG